MATTAAALNSKTNDEYLKNAEDAFTIFDKADLKSKWDPFLKWQACITDWHAKKPGDCNAYLEKSVLPQLSEEKYGTKIPPLVLLPFLKKLSQDIFLKQVNITLNSKKMLEKLCADLMNQPEHDEELKDTPISFQAMFPHILNLIDEHTHKHREELDIFFKRLIPKYTRELIAALPNITQRCPGFLIRIQERLKLQEHLPPNTTVDPALAEAIEKNMLDYCKLPLGGNDDQIRFLDFLSENNPNDAILFRHLRFKDYFNEAKTIGEKLKLIFRLCAWAHKGDYISCYELLATLLQVPPPFAFGEQSPLVSGEESPLPAILLSNFSSLIETIPHLFKHAKASLDVQMMVLHSTFSLPTEDELTTLARSYGELVYHITSKSAEDAKASKESTPGVATATTAAAAAGISVSLNTATAASGTTTVSGATNLTASAAFIPETASKKEANETISNPHYSELMASLSIPQGISLAQIDAATNWWLEQLKKNEWGKEDYMESIVDRWISRYREGQEEMTDKWSSELQEKHQKFKEFLKSGLIKLATRGTFEIRLSPFSLCPLLYHALKHANLPTEGCLANNAHMIIAGNRVLKEGSITVYGKSTEIVSTQSLISQIKDSAVSNAVTTAAQKPFTPAASAASATAASAIAASATAASATAASDNAKQPEGSPSSSVKAKKVFMS